MLFLHSAADEIIIHPLIDSAKVLLISFIIYVILSFFEEKISNILTKKKKVSPIIGAASGLIPQCGVSVVAADLYKKEHISAGTIMAIFFACSDEALPLMLTSKNSAIMVIPLILIKFILGFLLGYIVDIIVNKKNLKEIEENEAIHVGCCHHEIDNHNEGKLHRHFLHPLLHSLKILGYVLIINIIFSTIIYFIGEDTLTNFMLSNKILSPILTAIIGLIPNCASSVLITELYVLNNIPFGALVSGLCVNAGLGFVYLFKYKELRKKAFIMMLSLFLYSLIIGYLTIIIEFII